MGPPRALAKGMESIQHGQELLTKDREAVFHPGGNLRVDRSRHNPISLQLTQLSSQNLLTDAFKGTLLL